jgi:hypothetical protein
LNKKKEKKKAFPIRNPPPNMGLKYKKYRNIVNRKVIIGIKYVMTSFTVIKQMVDILTIGEFNFAKFIEDRFSLL